MIRRLRIGSRLALAFAVILLLTFFGSIIGLWQFLQVRAQAQQLNQINGVSIAILRVNNDVLKLKNELQRSVEMEDADYFTSEAKSLRDQLRDDVEAATLALQASPAGEQETRYGTQLRQLADVAALPSQVDTMIELAEAGDWLALQLRLENQIEQVSRTTQTLVESIDNLVAAERDLALEKLEQTQNQAFVALVVTGMVTLTTAGLLGFLVMRSISLPLAHLNAGAKALARQQFDYRVGIVGDDELATLSRVFDDAAERLARLYANLEESVRQRTEALERQTMQLETSFAVGQRITSILDLNALLPQVAELIRHRYGYYYVAVFLLDEAGAHLTAQSDNTDQAGESFPHHGFRLEMDQDNLIGWVALNGQPALIPDLFQESRFVSLTARPNARSELALPLRMGDKVLGVLDIQSGKVAAFKEDDVSALQSLADQVAIAIQNASLYRGEQSRRELAEILQRAGRAISSTLDLTEVLDLIMENLAGLVPYDRASILLQQGDELEIVAASGFPETISPLQLRVPITEDGVFDRIANTNQPLVIPDVLERPEWLQLSDLPQARAWMGVPITRLDRVVGMFSMVRETPNAYDEDEVTLAAAFAGQAAIALENARLYDQVVSSSLHLEELVRQRTEELEEAYSQLAHLDQTKTDFISIAAHELRTPLTILQGYSKMLLNDPLIQKNTHHHELVSGIHSGTIRLHEVVNSMLDITKIDSRSLELYPEPLSIPLVLELVSERFVTPLAERELTLIREDMSSLPAVEADPDALQKVFYHLIGNAIKYTPDGGTITISGRAQTDSHGPSPVEGIEIVVSDTGIGIDPAAQELIFVKFYQTGELTLHSTGKTKYRGAGPGLGLAIVRGIMEAHQGRVWVESPGYDEETSPGSRFHLFLPLRQSHSSKSSLEE